MTDELHKRILEDIGKTGYPCELRTQATLTAAGWHVSGNRYYLDEDEQKGREVDLDAYSNSYDHSGTPYVCVGGSLSIEVKKSEKPWVIFSSPLDDFRGLGGGYSLLHHSQNVDTKILPYEVIMGEHPAQGALRLGRSLYVAFCGGDANPSAFAAIVSALKAAYAQHASAAEHKEAWSGDSVDVTFYTPVVVLDGMLFECHLDDSGDPVVREAPLVTMEVSYLSAAYAERQYLVDVVTASEVRAYANRHQRWLADMQRHLTGVVRMSTPAGGPEGVSA